MSQTGRTDGRGLQRLMRVLLRILERLVNEFRWRELGTPVGRLDLACGVERERIHQLQRLLRLARLE